MHQVIYFSKGGNTRKVADAIAGELGVTAQNVAQAVLGKEGEGVVFLGSGCYGKKPNPSVLQFIKDNDFQGRRVAVFGTSGGGKGLALKDMTEALKAKGVSVCGSFDCKGKFGVFNRGRPDESDLAKARSFVQETMKAG
jgi:flavodoxin